MNKKEDFPRVSFKLVNKNGSQTFYSVEALQKQIEYYRTEKWCKDDPTIQPRCIIKITEEYVDVADIEKKSES